MRWNPGFDKRVVGFETYSDHERCSSMSNMAFGSASTLRCEALGSGLGPREEER
jgi:hypothetical protein